MAQLPEFRGRFTIGTSSDDFGVGSNTLTVTSGTYYTAGHSTESNGLIDNVETQIRTIAGQANTNVTYSASTGLVTIALNVAANITWDDVPLAYALGFAGDLASAATHTGTRVPRHIWRPTKGVSGHPVDLNTFWQPRSSTILTRAPDGTTVTRKGSDVYDAVIEFANLPAADVITPGTGTIYRDLQQFFVDVAHEGQPIRVYVDRETEVSDVCFEALWGDDEDEELGSFMDHIGRKVPSWNSLWDISIPLTKKV